MYADEWSPNTREELIDRIREVIDQPDVARSSRSDDNAVSQNLDDCGVFDCVHL